MEERGRETQWDIRKRGGKGGGGGLHCRSYSAPCEKWSAIGRKRKSREGRGEISRLYALYLGEGEKIMRSQKHRIQKKSKFVLCSDMEYLKNEQKFNRASGVSVSSIDFPQKTGQKKSSFSATKRSKKTPKKAPLLLPRPRSPAAQPEIHSLFVLDR